MGWRALTVVLVLAAALSDAAGAHDLAFYALLAAVPAAAVSALALVGDLVESLIQARADTLIQLQTLLSGIVLVLILTAAAVRSATLPEGASVPTVGASAVVACLGVLCLEAVLAIVVQVRRRPAL